MNKEELIKALDRNSKAIFYTSICCTAFWISFGILSYRYIVDGRPTTIDHEKQMMAGFYKRDVKIKMDSISNALMIQTLKHQLVKKQMKVDSLEKAYMAALKEKAERFKKLDREEYELDEHMLFMNLRERIRKDYKENHPDIQVLNSNEYTARYHPTKL